MRFRHTLALLAASALAVLCLWVTAERRTPPRAAQPHSRRVFDFAIEDMRHVVVENRGVRMELRREPGGWFVVSPIRAKANEGEVARLLTLVEELPVLDRVTPEERSERKLELADYGLGRPQARVWIGDGGTRSRELLLGGGAALGAQVYARLTDSRDVIATAAAITNAIPRRIEKIREKRLLPVDADRVTRVDIHRSDTPFVQLARANGTWSLQQPVVAAADRGRVRSFLDALLALEAQEFVWDRRTDSAAGILAAGASADVRMEPYGLAADGAALRIAVAVAGQESGSELLFGRPLSDASRRVYARVRGVDSVYAVAADVFRQLTVQPDELRERRIFPAGPDDVRRMSFHRGEHKVVLSRAARGPWRMEEPAQWEADPAITDGVLLSLLQWRTTAFLDGARSNAPALYGLQTPVLGIRLGGDGDRPPPSDARPTLPAAGAVRRPENPVASSRLLLVGRSDSRPTSVFARFEGDTAVFELPAKDLASLGPDPADPLYYRVRTVLALDPDHVNRIVLARESLRQIVERRDDGTWKAVSPASQEADPSAVSALLLAVANLRALRIEAHNPPDLARFGLAEPRLTLTFSLSGEESIQKSLLIGRRVVSGGCFAAVQGQDVVFILADEVADRMVTRLIKFRAR